VIRGTQALPPRVLIIACWLILLLLAGRMVWMGAGMLREARGLPAGPAGPDAVGGADAQMMAFQQMARQKWEQDRAEAARQRETRGWALIILGAGLAAGWTTAAYLLWNSPRIAGHRPRQNPDPLL
jgi:hypothetical protein